MLKQFLAGSFVLTLVMAGSVFAAPGWAQSTTSPSRQPSQAATGHSAQTPAPQTQVSQADLQKFALVLQQIHTIQQEGRSQALQVLQQQGLTEAQFNAIAQARQPTTTSPSHTSPQGNGTAQANGTAQVNASPAANFTPEQLQHFDQANAQLTQMHQATLTRMQQALASQGLTVDQFNTILATVRRDPQVEQQVLTLLHPQGS